MGTSALVTPDHYPDEPEIKALIDQFKDFGLSSVVDDGEASQNLPGTMLSTKELTPEGRELLENQWDLYQKAKAKGFKNLLEERLKKGETALPEGILIHGTRYDREKLTSVAKHGVVSGEIMGITEDGETHYCADFFRVPEDMSFDEYLSFISTSENIGKIRKSKMEADYLPKLNDRASKVGIIFDAGNPAVEALQKNDAYRSDDETLGGIINYLPIKEEEAVDRVSAILRGLPANLISGLIITDSIANDPEEAGFLKKRFPRGVLLTVNGEIVS